MIPILHHISLNILIPKLSLNHKRSSTFPQFFNNSKRKRMLVTKSKNPMGRSKFSKSKSNTTELGNGIRISIFSSNMINMHFDSFLSLNKKYGNRTLSTQKTNWYLNLMIKNNCHGANGYNL